MKIIPLLRQKKFLSQKTYTLCVTKDESIFALATNEMMKEVVAEAKAQAKAEGGGFFKQWGAQMGAALNHAKRYEKMKADEIKNETPGTFAWKNTDIKKVKTSTYRDEQGGREYTTVTFVTSGSKYKFTTEQDVTKALKEAYGDKVA